MASEIALIESRTARIFYFLFFYISSFFATGLLGVIPYRLGIRNSTLTLLTVLVLAVVCTILIAIWQRKRIADAVRVGPNAMLPGQIVVAGICLGQSTFAALLLFAILSMSSALGH